MRIDRTSGGMSGGAGPTTHTAKEGETLGSIAADFNVSSRALAKANKLPADASIHAGQELVIPFGKHAEAKLSRGLGDVRDAIEMGAAAKAFAEGAASKAFMQGAAAKAFVEGAASKAFLEGAASKAFLEGAASKAFLEGAASKAFLEGAASKAFLEGAASKAFLEGAASKAFLEGAASKAFLEGAASSSYQIQQGDTLKSIAGRLGVSVQDLAKANNMRTNARLTMGLELKVPSKG